MHQDNLSLDRREMIKHMALACGLALSATSLNALATELLKPTDFSRIKSSLLNANQLLILREISEVIIPTTDTPGAITAGVHDFINHYAAQCLTQNEQEQFVNALTTVDVSAQSQYQQTFNQLDLKQKTRLLEKMEQASAPFSRQHRIDIKQIKSLVTFAYYTSEIGATQELAYLALPGGYKGNFKFKDIGKAWSLSQ